MAEVITQTQKDHPEVVVRHTQNATPTDSVPPPSLGRRFTINDAVLNALPIRDTKVESARNYGMSLWGQAVKIETILPNGEARDYLLKVVSLPDVSKHMMRGEYEGLKAMHDVSPQMAPEPHAWGHYQEDGRDVYFIIAEFRLVGEQPPDPVRFTARLAELHRKSVSPTGKFGFHTTTCHGKVPLLSDIWEESWSVLYQKQLSHVIALDEERNGPWPEFKIVCGIVVNNVIPRLLLPLQSDGRSIKPCLVHGDLWDENTATDMNTGEPFIFDPAAMYAHNEYETGNWRAARHRLSNRVYTHNYKRHFPVSEPEEDWAARNILYSLRYNLGAAILFPGCVQRQEVFKDMTDLCEQFFPDLFRTKQQEMRLQNMSLNDASAGASSNLDIHGEHGANLPGETEEEEEEEPISD